MELLFQFLGIIFCSTIASICIFKPEIVSKFLKNSYTLPSKIITKATGIELNLGSRKTIIRFAGFTFLLVALMGLFAIISK